MQQDSAESVRFIHTADWQLGATRTFLDDDAQARWTASRFDAIRRLGQLADEEKCEFVVVAGDVFESNQVDRRTVLRACEALASIPVPVFLLPGNHDPFDAGTVFESSAWISNKPENVHVLSDPTTPHEVRPNVEVVGAPWFSKRPLGDLVAEGFASNPPLQDGVRVMVAHGATDDLSPDRDNPALIIVEQAEAALASGRGHYLALGDRHSVTDIGSSGRIWYSGTPEVYAFAEVDPGHSLLVNVDRNGCDVIPLDVGTWKFTRREFDIQGEADITAVEEFLQAVENKEQTVIRLTLVGTVSLLDHARLVEIIERFDDLFAGVHESESRSDLVVVPNDEDFANLSVSGFAATAVEKLRATADSGGTDGDEARDALALLVRLAGTEQ